MFNKYNQNYFLIKQCQDVKGSIIDNCVNKIFFDHIEKPDKSKQMAVVEQLKDFQDEKLSRGFGKIGFENLVANLSNENSSIVKSSLEKLENELKNPHSACVALNIGILNKLFLIILQNSSVEKSDILHLTLQILNILAKSFKGSLLIAENGKLIELILAIMKHQFDLSDTCAEILQTLTGNPHATQVLLNSEHFIVELQHFIHNTSSEKFFSVLSHFIATKPVIFAKIEILKSLINNICMSKALKCLALILNCDDCRHDVRQMKIENLLLDVLVAEACDDETKTYAIMAFRNYLTYTNIYTDEFPWKRLLMILVEGAYTKENELLQESCIQTLRIMSDYCIVKECLCKTYKAKLRNIPPLTERSREIKKDLLEWLKYRNYKDNNQCGNYSNLFI